MSTSGTGVARYRTFPLSPFLTFSVGKEDPQHSGSPVETRNPTRPVDFLRHARLSILSILTACPRVDYFQLTANALLTRNCRMVFFQGRPSNLFLSLEAG